ncbi:hypothetical protein L9F63_016660, partial [Diploptera punctata]
IRSPRYFTLFSYMWYVWPTYICLNFVIATLVSVTICLLLGYHKTCFFNNSK